MTSLDALTRINEDFAPLLQAARRKAPSHAYLLHGPSAAAALHFARHFARALNCQGPEAPCEVCPSCLQDLADRSDAIHLIRPTGVDIRIDQIRELIEASRYRYGGDRFKVFVLCPAEAMNEQAANAFLKILEEPTARTVFLLVTDRPDALLSTIRSRCSPQRLAFPPARQLVDELLPASHPGRDLAWLALMLGDCSPSSLRWVIELGEDPDRRDCGLPGEGDRWGLSFLNDDEAIARRLFSCEALRENAPDLLALFDTTLRQLAALFETPDFEEAFLAGLQAAHGGTNRLEEELPKRFKTLRSAWNRSQGEGAVHPVLSEDRDVTASTRLWTFSWMDAFLRSMLLAFRLATRLHHGPPDPLLEACLARHPGLAILSRLPLVALGRMHRSVEEARRHVYANVKPLRLIIQNLYSAFLQHAGVVPARSASGPPSFDGESGSHDESWMES